MRLYCLNLVTNTDPWQALFEFCNYIDSVVFVILRFSSEVEILSLPSAVLRSSGPH